MALKAGRVGVKASLVDEYGNIKGTGADIEERLDDVEELTANIDENLTANEKSFVFAYDEDSDSYGYKAGLDGEFKPFSSGGGEIGTLFPYELASTEGLTFHEWIQLNAGGYLIKDGVVYVDMELECIAPTGSQITSGNAIVSNLPTPIGTAYYLYDFHKSIAGSSLDAMSYRTFNTSSTGVVSITNGSAMKNNNYNKLRVLGYYFIGEE